MRLRFDRLLPMCLPIPRRRCLGVLTMTAAALFAGLPLLPARAQANVHVQVRDGAGRPKDGRVTLTPRGGGAASSCVTANGACDMGGVAGGQYTVSFVPAAGAASAPRMAMIPPSGRVDLIVAADAR